MVDILYQLILDYAMTGVLLISGPQSSGKSSLVESLVSNFPNCVKIDREKIISDADNVFFGEFFQKAESLTGKNVNSFLTLSTLDNGQFNNETSALLSTLQKECYQYYTNNRIAFLTTIFKEYNQLINNNIQNNLNTIIDEGLIYSDEDYELFKECLGANGVDTKRILIFNTINETLAKCDIRNKKFLTKLDQYKDLETTIKAMEQEEAETSYSTSSYRFPTTIMKYYKRYYDFKNNRNDTDLVLDEIDFDDLGGTIDKINILQSELLERIGSGKNNLLDKESVLQEIYDGSEIVYVTSKAKYNKIIYSRKIESLDSLSNKNFVRDLYGEELSLWLNINDTFHEEELMDLLLQIGSSDKDKAYDETMQKPHNQVLLDNPEHDAENNILGQDSGVNDENLFLGDLPNSNLNYE